MSTDRFDLANCLAMFYQPTPEEYMLRNEVFMILFTEFFPNVQVSRSEIEGLKNRNEVPIMMLPNAWFYLNVVANVVDSKKKGEIWALQDWCRGLNPWLLTEKELGREIERIQAGMDNASFMDDGQIDKLLDKCDKRQQGSVAKTVRKHLGLKKGELDGVARAKIEDIAQKIQIASLPRWITIGIHVADASG